MKNFMFVTLGLLHGLRPHERTQLMKTDFNFEDLVIDLRWETVKTRKGRAVAMNSLCAPIYEEYFESYPSPYVFPHANDNQKHACRGWYQFRWRKLLRCAGLFDRDTGQLFDITPHDLRATCEKFVHLDPTISDTVKEKNFGAAIDVQKKTYVTKIEADELRSVAETMTNSKHGVVGLSEILAS